MHGRMRLAALPLAAAAWIASSAPAWANAVDPELYPEAAEDYNRTMVTVFGSIFGCFALIVLGTIALVALLVMWLVRRNRRMREEALAAQPAQMPPGATPPGPQDPAEAPRPPDAP